ncbi:Non-canonical polyA RNA polymerase PAPD5 [Hondaea fermentalgiana]|uniref:Non-canonical polyA RNA polymerase PAPD5 n=1 Tax=Hondaea fermentalgiana TaxID=2315210 RepID=A0A2R5GW34_9STRA|nr:Non-canonical polyA RNA polymerase PAPD5 [Hondaea fermentalgiana]|eukprot:GBG34539.1 Non-canonical polyA RNA polymerase PAPD5 [Hondaea fermentalgiana]
MRRARVQEIRQKRKAEAPFYVALHRWVLSAKHRHACSEHEQELLRVQALLMQGEITKQEMQERVRELVGANVQSQAAKQTPSLPNEATTKKTRSTSPDAPKLAASTAIRTPSDSPELNETRGTSQRIQFWHYCTSFAGEWEAFAGLQESKAELLLRRQARSGGGVRATYRYQLGCRSKHAMASCLFSLLRRFSGEPKGLEELDPVPGSHELSFVSLSYSPAETAPQTRWEEISRQVTQEASKEYEDLVTAIRRLQSRCGAKLDHSDIESACATSGSESFAGALQRTLARKSKWRMELQWRIQTVIQSVFPCAQVHLFGSHACGLALPTSDVDLYYMHRQNVCFASASYTGHMAGYHQSGTCSLIRMAVADQLEMLQNAFLVEAWVKRARIIKSSQMYIVRLSTCLLALNGEAEDTHKTSADHLCPMCCEVDVSSAHLNGHSFALSSDLLAQERSRHQHLLPLTLVLKQLLQERGLLDPYSGGLSSISLSLMVLRYLQYQEDKSRSAARPTKPPRFSRRPGTGVVLAPPHAAQFAYSRQLADWPDARAPPPAYVSHQATREVLSESSAAENVTETSTSTAQDNAAKDNGSILSPSPSPSPYKDIVSGRFAKAQPDSLAYRRQLADWPTSEAAHHMEWMRVIKKTRGSAPLASSKQALSKDANGGVEADDETNESAFEMENLDADLLGEDLLGLLEFYGFHFKPDRVGLTVIGRGAFYSLSAHAEHNRAAPQPITIDNPFWPNLNVSKATYRIGEVLSTFRNMHAILLGELSRLMDTFGADLEEAEDELPQAKPVMLRKVLRSKWQNLL